MQELKVIGVESDALVAASDDGDRFRIAIDDVLQSRLKQRMPDSGQNRKASPREIQAHIRSGMSASDVASVTGASIEYIQRFEGPILAEREYIVSSALSVPVHTASDIDPLEGAMGFGAVIRERLAALHATGERWSSWKEDDGEWVIKLSFTVDDIDHDARWSFDPKKLLLLPMNAEANTLSQHGDAPATLIPRLRAVGPETAPVDVSRFDSGAFSFTRDQFTRDRGVVREHPSARDHSPAPEHPAAPEPTSGEHVAMTSDHDAPAGDNVRPVVNAGTDTAAHAAINRATEPKRTTSQTADLLDALRRRRGERDSAQSAGVHDSVGPHGPVAPRAVGTVADHSGEAVRHDQTRHETGRADIAPAVGRNDSGHNDSAPVRPIAPPQTRKRGRVSMPSWDEIVFGARTDDDPA